MEWIGCLGPTADFSRLLLRIIPRHQLVDSALLVALADRGQRAGQVGERIDSVELAGLDQRGDSRPVLCSSIVSGEESILPVQRDWPDGSLDLGLERLRCDRSR
jgi:hypothetical protein